ncbi:MAG: hypothetical protein AB7K71_11125 [Polyangiaceae bacterium]
MEKPLREKVEEALREAVGEDAKIVLDEDTGQVGGFVLSGSFAPLSPSARQDLIWDKLDLRLTPFERTRITFIITDTPEEYAALEDAGE